jgi:hypothetical protein
MDLLGVYGGRLDRLTDAYDVAAAVVRPPVALRDHLIRALPRLAEMGWFANDSVPWPMTLTLRPTDLTGMRLVNQGAIVTSVDGLGPVLQACVATAGRRLVWGDDGPPPSSSQLCVFVESLGRVTNVEMTSDPKMGRVVMLALATVHPSEPLATTYGDSYWIDDHADYGNGGPHVGRYDALLTAAADWDGVPRSAVGLAAALVNSPQARAFAVERVDCATVTVTVRDFHPVSLVVDTDYGIVVLVVRHAQALVTVGADGTRAVAWTSRHVSLPLSGNGGMPIDELLGTNAAAVCAFLDVYDETRGPSCILDVLVGWLPPSVQYQATRCPDGAVVSRDTLVRFANQLDKFSDATVSLAVAQVGRDCWNDVNALRRALAADGASPSAVNGLHRAVWRAVSDSVEAHGPLYELLTLAKFLGVNRANHWRICDVTDAAAVVAAHDADADGPLLEPIWTVVGHEDEYRNRVAPHALAMVADDIGSTVTATLKHAILLDGASTQDDDRAATVEYVVRDTVDHALRQIVTKGLLRMLGTADCQEERPLDSKDYTTVVRLPPDYFDARSACAQRRLFGHNA